MPRESGGKAGGSADSSMDQRGAAVPGHRFAIFRMRTSYLILLIVMNFFWAGSLSIYKELAPHLATGGIVTLRFGMAGLLLAVLWPWLPGKTPRGIELVKTALMGQIVFTLGHRLQVLGVKMGTAG